jgi:hypothetical protein
MLWCVIIRACMRLPTFIHSVCAIRTDGFGANGGVRGSKVCPMFLAVWPGADNHPLLYEYTFLLLSSKGISRCLVTLQRRDFRSNGNHQTRRRLLGGQAILLLRLSYRCRNQLLVIGKRKKTTTRFLLFCPTLRRRHCSHDVEIHCSGIGWFVGPIRLLGYDFEGVLDNFLHLLFGSRIGSQHQTEKAWKMGRQVFFFFFSLEFEFAT